MDSLDSSKAGLVAAGYPARNNSKGCGGVMRVAPAGLFSWRLEQRNSPQEAFELGKELAALTHGHSTGVLPGGVLSVLILLLTDGASLTEAISTAKGILHKARDHEETSRSIELAENLAKSDLPRSDAIADIGQGWIAEEALAISIYGSLVAGNFRQGVILAVNHDGDSDSTGSITGSLLGAFYGATEIPQEWLESLEMRDVISELAHDLFEYRDWKIGEYSDNKEMNKKIWKKYPGF